jgi:cell division protein FtsB
VKAAPSHFRHASAGSILPRLNKVLVALIVAVAVVPLTYRALPGVSEKMRQDAQIASAEAELADARMVNSRLTREVTLLRNDSEYLSIFARDAVNPGYMKPGETIFRLPPRQK